MGLFLHFNLGLYQGIYRANINKERENWLLIKEKDEYAKIENDVSQFKTSVRSGPTMLEIDEEKDENL